MSNTGQNTHLTGDVMFKTRHTRYDNKLYHIHKYIEQTKKEGKMVKVQKKKTKETTNERR